MEAVKTGKEKKKIDILVLDNRKSIIPGLILRKILRPDVTIIDCRELYIKKEVKHIAGKIGCLIERKGIETADVIICANEFRSKKRFYITSKIFIQVKLFIKGRMASESSNSSKRKGD